MGLTWQELKPSEQALARGNYKGGLLSDLFYDKENQQRKKAVRQIAALRKMLKECDPYTRTTLDSTAPLEFSETGVVRLQTEYVGKLLDHWDGALNILRAKSRRPSENRYRLLISSLAEIWSDRAMGPVTLPHPSNKKDASAGSYYSTPFAVFVASALAEIEQMPEQLAFTKARSQGLALQLVAPKRASKK